VGYKINVKGDFSTRDIASLKGYLKQLVQDATGERVQRVITHGVMEAQSQQEARRQLLLLQRQQS